MGGIFLSGGGGLLSKGGIFLRVSSLEGGGLGVLVRRGGASLGGKRIFCPLRLMLP